MKSDETVQTHKHARALSHNNWLSVLSHTPRFPELKCPPLLRSETRHAADHTAGSFYFLTKLPFAGNRQASASLARHPPHPQYSDRPLPVQSSEFLRCLQINPLREPPPPLVPVR